jgi:hypothetical protein
MNPTIAAFRGNQTIPKISRSFLRANQVQRNRRPSPVSSGPRRRSFGRFAVFNHLDTQQLDSLAASRPCTVDDRPDDFSVYITVSSLQWIFAGLGKLTSSDAAFLGRRLLRRRFLGCALLWQNVSTRRAGGESHARLTSSPTRFAAAEPPRRKPSRRRRPGAP